MVIPAEITSKHGVRQEELVRRGPEAKGIDDAVFEFATLANDHIITARSMLKEEGFNGNVPSGAMPVFLTGVRMDLVVTQRLIEVLNDFLSGSGDELATTLREERFQCVRP